MNKKAFLICPVRGHATEETASIVYNLEHDGWEVHWPPRDTNQNDPTGYRICTENLKAIRAADVVFVVWDGKSQGVLFDLGIAFSLDKPIHIIKLPDVINRKSFQDMIREWEQRK